MRSVRGFRGCRRGPCDARGEDRTDGLGEPLAGRSSMVALRGTGDFDKAGLSEL
jgi:hypothetical protein